MINETKNIGTPDIYTINNSCFVGVQFKEKRGDKFFDVVLLNNDEEKFLGRFVTELDNIRIKFNDGKILIYTHEFNDYSKMMQIIKVHSLYNIEDDLFYSCTEKEALNLFDSTIDSNYLRNENNNITRSDVEKRKRINVNYGNKINDDNNDNKKIIKFRN